MLFSLFSFHLIYTSVSDSCLHCKNILIQKGIKSEKEKKIESCPPLLSGQGTVGQMVPAVVLVQPGWLMAATEVGWAIPGHAGLWLARGGLAYGWRLPWQEGRALPPRLVGKSA